MSRALCLAIWLLAPVLVGATCAGCATMERHPVLTAVGVGLVAGSIAASSSHRTDAPADSLCRAPLSCR